MNFLRRFDWGILFATIALSGLGLLIQLSVAPTLIPSQLVFVLIGFIFFFLFSSINIQVYPSFKTILYIALILGLILTFLVGTEIRGSIRWIIVGGSRIQPSELAKPLLIILLATHFAKPEKKWRKFFTGGLLLLPGVILVFKQPDLGNTIVYLTVFTGIILAEGYFPAIVIGFLILGGFVPAFWHFLENYQRQRIITFLNPGIDPQGAGYNVLQATIAVGSGGLFGKGLGQGTQSHLNFLPEHHTDFIFASFAEEFGFIGVVILISLYTYLLASVLRCAQKTENKMGALMGVGVFSMLFPQIFINIGMNIGLVPITGITLPLLSYGGSSIISTMVSLGIVESLINRRKDQETLKIR